MEPYPRTTRPVGAAAAAGGAPATTQAAERLGSSVTDAGCWLLLLAVGGLAAGELQPRRWPTVGRFQPWAAASEQAEGNGWTKGNTEKEEGNNTTFVC